MYYTDVQKEVSCRNGVTKIIRIAFLRIIEIMEKKITKLIKAVFWNVAIYMYTKLNSFLCSLEHMETLFLLWVTFFLPKVICSKFKYKILLCIPTLLYMIKRNIAALQKQILYLKSKTQLYQFYVTFKRRILFCSCY